MIRALGWDLGTLALQWQDARPFPHLVFDNLLGDALGDLRNAFAREPHHPATGEVYELMSSSDPPQQPELRGFLTSLLNGEAGQALRRITGKELRHIEGRAYVYAEGHYLLPHSDCRAGLRRQLAFAYYVASEQLEGGELELFECDLDAGEIVATRPSVRIEHRPDRLVVFDVSEITLHQVCEVRRGARASIAGWLLG